MFLGELIINNYNKAIQITEKKKMLQNIKVKIKQKKKKLTLLDTDLFLKGKNVWLCYGQTLERYNCKSVPMHMSKLEYRFSINYKSVLRTCFKTREPLWTAKLNYSWTLACTEGSNKQQIKAFIG